MKQSTNDDMDQKKGSSQRHDPDDVRILKAWFEEHNKFPYPTESEKESLVRATKLNLAQVNNWFINQRRRTQSSSGPASVSAPAPRSSSATQQNQLDYSEDFSNETLEANPGWPPSAFPRPSSSVGYFTGIAAPSPLVSRPPNPPFFAYGGESSLSSHRAPSYPTSNHSLDASSFPGGKLTPMGTGSQFTQWDVATRTLESRFSQSSVNASYQFPAPPRRPWPTDTTVNPFPPSVNSNLNAPNSLYPPVDPATYRPVSPTSSSQPSAPGPPSYAIPNYTTQSRPGYPNYPNQGRSNYPGYSGPNGQTYRGY